MGTTFTIAGRDYAPYVRLYEDQVALGDADYIEPIFAGVGALSEGVQWVGDAVHARHWSIPLAIKSGSPPTTDAAHTLIGQMKKDLCQGAQVAFAPDGASNTSYFDLTRGVLRPEFHHPKHRKGWVFAMLELWTKPYATTGTTRTVASYSSTGPHTAIVTGVLGDVTALGNLRIGVGSWAGPSAFFPGNYVVAYGVKYPAASINDFVRWGASSALRGNATVIGGSGAIGSQYVGVFANATSAQLDVYREQLAPVAAWAGRYRVLVIARSRFFPATQNQIVGKYMLGNVTATLPVTPTWQATGWNLLDFGELTIPSTTATAAISFDTIASLANPAAPPSVVASAPIQINAVVMLPIDQNAGLIVGTSGQESINPAANASGAAQIGIREPVLLNSYPRTEALSLASGGSQALRDLSAAVRGGRPVVPAVGSPGASGPAKMVVLTGFTGQNVGANGALCPQFLGNDAVDVQLNAAERFSFLR